MIALPSRVREGIEGRARGLPAQVTEPTSSPAGPTALACGLQGLCPRCGEKTLFAGTIKFADRCAACGLDIAAFNLGDGPAAFLTLIIGAIVTVLAITLELSVEPPLWVHILIWTPVTTLAVVASLRVGKGMLLALEYRNRAGEGRERSAAPAPDAARNPAADRSGPEA